MDLTNNNCRNDFPPERKSVTPATSGFAPSTHGTRLPPKMTLKDRDQFMNELEAWRKAKREKISHPTASKQMPAPNSSSSGPKSMSSVRSSAIGCDPATQNKNSVYERLYKNTTRVSLMKRTEKSTETVKPVVRLSTKIPKSSSSVPLQRKSLLTNKVNQEAKVMKKPVKNSPGAVIKTSNDTINLREECNSELSTAFESDAVINTEKLDKTDQVMVSDVTQFKENMKEIECPEKLPHVIPEIIITDSNATTEEKTEISNDSDKSERGSGSDDNIEVNPKKEEFPNSKSLTDPPLVTHAQSSAASAKASTVTRQTSLRNNVTTTADTKAVGNFKAPKIKMSFGNLRKSFKATKPLRRSISMIHHQKKGSVNEAVHRTFSESNLSTLSKANDSKVRKSVRFPSDPDMKSKNVTFSTPKNKLQTPLHLRDKLDSWLTKHGHSLNRYRHLRCFGLNSNDIFNTPTNVLIDSPNTSSYTTAPNTPTNDEEEKENVTPPTAIQRINFDEVEKWLSELYRLIVDLKYPYNRCEEWLSAIRRKCASCSQLPIYWECLAALEESRGHFESAIEYYERAIIKGAEVDSISDSLTQLFDNMVLGSEKKTKKKQDKNVDIKNIFKSKVIKFALQQKAVKDLAPKLGNEAAQLLVATPVRRSTRIQTPYKAHVVNTLQSLKPEVRDQVKFQPNDFLMGE